MTTYKGFKIPENIEEIKEVNKSANKFLDIMFPCFLYIDKDKFNVPINTGVTVEDFSNNYEASYKCYLDIVKEFIDSYCKRNNVEEG